MDFLIKKKRIKIPLFFFSLEKIVSRTKVSLKIRATDWGSPQSASCVFQGRGKLPVRQTGSLNY